MQFLIERKNAALFLDPGLGKTSITLEAISHLKSKGAINRVLLIAPLRVCHSVWPAEIKKWSNFSHLKCVILHGPKKEDRLRENADLYVINPEGINWLLAANKVNGRLEIDLKRWAEFKFDTLVIDELTKFKSYSTSRFKLMKGILSTFTIRWGLTGSPAANSLMDLFGQCYMLDEGKTFSRYITHYRREYFYQEYGGFVWTLKEGAQDKIYKKLTPLALRMGEELIDMPSQVENDIYIHLPPKPMKIYREIERDLISKLEDGLITAGSAAAASMKCRQLANGAVYLDAEVIPLLKLPTSERKWANIHTAKLEALETLIEELQGEPLLIAYEFIHDLERIKHSLGADTPHIGGGVSTKRASEIENLWNEGKVPILLAHPQSIAHGLNLQNSGHHVAWYSLTWNYELYDQFNRRVRRQGNKAKRVFIHHIIAKDTIDELVLHALKDKKTGQNNLFVALKKLQGDNK